MTHRASEILSAVYDRVLARVAASGVHVYMHRRESVSVEQDELPAISVDFGEDEPAEQQIIDGIQAALSVPISILVQKPSETEARELLLQLRNECELAWRNDRRLGLSFVTYTFWAGASAPEISAENEMVDGSLTTTVRVIYELE